jgi:trimeric autotransporter adhesin
MPRTYGITNAAPYASAPAVGAVGDTYWSTAQKVLYASDGTAWLVVGPGAGGPPSGVAGGSLAGSYPNPTLTTTGVTAATYGTASKVAQITVNAEGRITAVVEVKLVGQWK